MSAITQSRPVFGKQLIASVSDVIRRLLHLERAGTIIVGADARMRLLAKELVAAGKKVTFVRLTDEAMVEPDAALEYDVVQSSEPDEKALARAGARWATCLVAATPDDPLNMNLCRMGRDRFGLPLTIARMRMLNSVTSWARFDQTGMVRMSWADAAHAILGEVTPRGRVLRVANADDLEQVADVAVKSPVFAGRTILELPLRGCEAIALTREDRPVDGFNLEKLRLGDVLTLIGSKDAVDKAREIFTSL